MDRDEGGMKPTGLYRENSNDSGFRALVEDQEGDNHFLFSNSIAEDGNGGDLFQEPLHSSKVGEEDFPLHNTPVAEVFSSSKASMSFNNSMTEGEFGVFEYEPEGGLRKNNSSLSDGGPAWVHEKNDELHGSLQGHERTRETPLMHEPVRPPSRHQQTPQDQYGSFRQHHQQSTSNHDSGSHNNLAYGSSSFSHLAVSEVSVEDVRQRQMSQQQMQMAQQPHQNQFLHSDQHRMPPQQLQPQHDSMMSRPFDTPLDQSIVQQQPTPSNIYQTDYTMNVQQQNTGYGGSSSYQQQQPQQPQHHVSGVQDLHGSSHSLGMNNGIHTTSAFSPNDMAQCNSMQQRNNDVHGNNHMYQQPCSNSNSPQAPANGSFYQHRQQGQSSISMPAMQGNVSIASNNNSTDPNTKTMYSGMGSVNPPPIQGDVAAAMSEAMEKLSDSMKRTAMSRSMVKQFSGRNIVRHGSSRGLLSKQNSRRGMLVSQRSVRAQTSDKNLMNGDSGRASLRRTNSKHHLQHPNRMFLHDSQGSLGLSQSGHNSFSIQMDGGRNVGGF